MKYIIDFIYLITLLIISPKIIYRMLRQNRYRHGWSQRFGNIRRKHPDKKCIWIHAVSVGEVNATRTLTHLLEKQLPDYEIVISTTTDTGYERARNLYSKHYAVFYFPADFSMIMKKAFQRISPDICLLMELEIWPNFVATANQMKVPVIVVNGRLSERSFPRYKLIKGLTAKMFNKVDLFLVQSLEYADRFRELGCPENKLIITSSLKYDTAKIIDKVEGTDKLAKQLNVTNKTIWVAGGTGPGEEKIIINLYKLLRTDPKLTELRLAIIPRKPERFDEVAELIEKAGFSFVRYSELKHSDTSLNECPQVILGDTMGDLTKFYSLASVAFVGRSLVPMGGSDMMESAALGKCTVFGPHTFNFTQTVKALLNDVGAIQVSDTDELYEITRKCLSEPNFAKAIAAKGREVIRQNQGATEKTVNAILSVLARK